MSQPRRWEYTLKCTGFFFFLRFFFFFSELFSVFSSHTKKGGKALLHYKGLQMYNYTVRSMWSLLGYIIDTDSTSKPRKTTKFYIYIYIYMQRSTPSIHVIFIEARPEKRFSHAKWSVCWLADGVFSSMILWCKKRKLNTCSYNSN